MVYILTYTTILAVDISNRMRANINGMKMPHFGKRGLETQPSDEKPIVEVTAKNLSIFSRLQDSTIKELLDDWNTLRVRGSGRYDEIELKRVSDSIIERYYLLRDTQS